jgi:hypothetical protein
MTIPAALLVAAVPQAASAAPAIGASALTFAAETPVENVHYYGYGRGYYGGYGGYGRGYYGGYGRGYYGGYGRGYYGGYGGYYGGYGRGYYGGHGYYYR